MKKLFFVLFLLICCASFPLKVPYRKGYVINVDGKPTSFKWSDGAFFEITRDDIDAQIFEGIGRGFKPDEELNFISKSENEVMTYSGSVDSNGSLYILLAPAVLGKRRGIAEYTIKRHNNPEVCVIKYNWGVPPQ